MEMNKNFFKAKAGKKVKNKGKQSKMFQILEGISIDEVNKARGGASDVKISVNPRATTIEPVNFD